MPINWCKAGRRGNLPPTLIGFVHGEAKYRIMPVRTVDGSGAVFQRLSRYDGATIAELPSEAAAKQKAEEING